MALLKYNNSTREETDLDIIVNLLRKGWTDITPSSIPSYNHDIEKLIYDENTDTYTVVPLNSDELATIAADKAVMDLSIQKGQQRQAIIDQINAGFTVEPEGFVLGLQDADRSAFSQYLTLIKEALDLQYITNDTIQTISDINNNPIELTTLRLREILVQYGFFYKTLWNSLL